MICLAPVVLRYLMVDYITERPGTYAVVSILTKFSLILRSF